MMFQELCRGASGCFMGAGCHNPSPRGHIVDRKFALGHRKGQFISVYASKDLPILHFVYLYVGYISFHFFALISFV